MPIGFLMETIPSLDILGCEFVISILTVQLSSTENNVFSSAHPTQCSILPLLMHISCWYSIPLSIIVSLISLFLFSFLLSKLHTGEGKRGGKGKGEGKREGKGGMEIGVLGGYCLGKRNKKRGNRVREGRERGAKR